MSTNKDNKRDHSKIKSWYSNRHQLVVVQRNILLVLTLVSMISVAASVVFVRSVMSSKSLEPYLIEVEEKTGITTVVNQMTAQNFSGDQIIRKYFINKFVNDASGYDPRTFRQNAEEVRLFSTPSVYSDFKNRINPRELGANSKITVRIKSILFQDQNVAQVRILRQIESEVSGNSTKDEVITMGFYFSPEMILTMEERLINPLGFQVNKYQIADEVFSY